MGRCIKTIGVIFSYRYIVHYIEVYYSRYTVATLTVKLFPKKVKGKLHWTALQQPTALQYRFYGIIH